MCFRDRMLIYTYSMQYLKCNKNDRVSLTIVNISVAKFFYHSRIVMKISVCVFICSARFK